MILQRVQLLRNATVLKQLNTQNKVSELINGSGH